MVQLRFAEPVASEYKWFAWYPVKTVDRGWRWLWLVNKRKYMPHSWLDNAGGEFFMHSVKKGELL